MSHLVIARKYRPGTFASVRGQDHVTRTLVHSIARNRIAHAYLFSGPRGVGKTSMARIFAKAINCEKNKALENTSESSGKKSADSGVAKGESSKDHIEPCGVCQSCTEIAAGTSFAVREIDGASHNSVDNVRDLIDSFRALPPPGSRCKVYIIDEVHMLSLAAFNALLKSLEEPPPNTIFILATTEANRIPETVLSRCQRFDFRAISFETIVAQLEYIGRDQKLKVEPEVYRMVARLADGSMRDAQSLFERLQVFCEGTITAEAAGEAFGVIDRSTLAELVHGILKRDSASALATLERSIAKGVDVSLLIRDIAAYWRELLLVGYGNQDVTDRLGFSSDELERLKRLLSDVSKEDLVVAVDLIRNGCDAALRTTFSRAALEALVVRSCMREPSANIERLLSEISNQNTAAVSSTPRRVAAPLAGHATGAESSPTPITGEKELESASSVTTTRSGAVSTDNRSAPESPEVAIAAASQLDWGVFVQAVATRSKVIHEHLKRLSPSVFSLGKLQATGASFTVTALQMESNYKRLGEILTELFGSQMSQSSQTGQIPRWNIKLTSTATGSQLGGVPSESIEGHDRASAEDRRAKTTEALSEHPSVKAIQKFFPGSQIDKIRVSD